MNQTLSELARLVGTKRDPKDALRLVRITRGLGVNYRETFELVRRKSGGTLRIDEWDELMQEIDDR